MLVLYSGKIQIILRPDKNVGHFTWGPKHGFCCRRHEVATKSALFDWIGIGMVVGLFVPLSACISAAPTGRVVKWCQPLG